jgi:hypothetical protein
MVPSGATTMEPGSPRRAKAPRPKREVVSPGLPATVTTVPSGSTRRMQWLFLSAM